MEVRIKRFNVDMHVKNSGIEFEIRDTNGAHLGDFVLTKSKIEWCQGKTKAGNGIQMAWTELIDYMQS